MAASLWISDASPLFFYSPSPVYFSGQALASWTGISGTNTSGSSGASSHTSTGTAAVILPEIYATAFSPIFTSSSSYNVSLTADSDSAVSWTSGQNWTSTNFVAQTFLLDVECLNSSRVCSDEFSFDGAWIETELAPSSSVVQNVTLDDASPLVQYSGFAAIGSSSTEVAVSASEDYESTLSSTSTAGATAEVVFIAASISILGVVCPACATYTITLDGNLVATLDSSNNVTVHGVIMYFATNLATGTTHTLVITAVGGGAVILDSFTVYGPQGAVGFLGTNDGVTTTVGPASTGTSTTGATSTSTGQAGATTGGSPNAGVIVGAILGTLAGLGLIGYLCRRVAPALKKAEEKKLDPWDEANLLQNMKNEEVHVTTAASQRYVYPGLIAHSDLKKKW